MATVLRPELLVRKGDPCRSLVLAAGVDTRIMRAPERRVRLGVVVASVGTDPNVLLDLVGTVLMDALIGAPTERCVSAGARRIVVSWVNVDDLRFRSAG